MRRGRGLLSVVLGITLLVSACAQGYVDVQTDSRNPLAAEDLEPGDHVRVGLDDGRTIEGRLAYLGAGRYQVGPTEISEASVVSVSRREAKIGTTMVVGLVVGVMVVAALVASAINDLDFGK